MGTSAVASVPFLSSSSLIACSVDTSKLEEKLVICMTWMVPALTANTTIKHLVNRYNPGAFGLCAILVPTNAQIIDNATRRRIKVREPRHAQTESDGRSRIVVAYYDTTQPRLSRRRSRYHCRRSVSFKVSPNPAIAKTPTQPMTTSHVHGVGGNLPVSNTAAEVFPQRLGLGAER